MRRIVVCDTGPLLHLGEANAIHLLRLAGEIIVPLVVAREFELNAPDRDLPDWVQVKTLDDMYSQKALEWARHVDAGESAAIALALQTQADWLLSDDAGARQFAQALGLEVHGSIGLLLWGAASGRLAGREEALSLLDALAGSSLWVSERVLQQAREAVETLFSA